MSDYTQGALEVFWSYDGGATYSAKQARSDDPVIMEQDALVMLRVQSVPWAKQQNPDTLASLLVADIQTVGKSIDNINTRLDTIQPLTEVDLNNASLWEKGFISEAGANYKDYRFVRTKGFLSDDVELVYAEKDYFLNVFVYDGEGNFVGYWNGEKITNGPTATKYFNPKGLQDYKIRLGCRRYDIASSYVMDVSESANIHFLNSIHKNAFFQKPTLTFIDDDGSAEALANWEAIADEIGVKITSALVTGVMGDGENNPLKASWEDVSRLQNKGFEFVSHTHDHIRLTDRTEEVCVQQFKDSIAALREHNCESRYLVYPYNTVRTYDADGKLETDRMPVVKQYFSAGVGMSHAKDNTVPIRPYDIYRYSINVDEALPDGSYPLKDLDTLKGHIDTAITNHSWVIIMTHLRNNSDDFRYDNATQKQMIIDLCKYAAEKGMAIQTFGEAFPRYKNRLEKGIIIDAEHYIVDCNGVVHYRGQTE